MLHSSSYFFIISLLSLVGTCVKYLFLLISSKYQFTLLIIRYKEFILLIFKYFQYLIVTCQLWWITIFLYDVSSILILFGSKIFILTTSSRKKALCMVFYIYIFEFITHFQFKLSIWNSFNLLFVTWIIINVVVLLDILSNNSKY